MKQTSLPVTIFILSPDWICIVYTNKTSVMLNNVP